MLLLGFIVMSLSLWTVSAYDAYATHFDAIGTPYGGCGLPEDALESLDYVAVNVQNTPGDYTTYYTRPISDSSKVGTFANGNACGRWVRVTLGDLCKGGANSGEVHSNYCAGGSFVSDKYNGATLDLLITDSCQDGNRWCRDDQYHLDIHTSSLVKFKKNGTAVGSDIYNSWNNRKISWNYITAPNYKGDIKIGFRRDADQQWYLAIAISNLPNGITRVERFWNGGWTSAGMISDNGQAFILPQGPPPYKIRYFDIRNARSKEYTFNFPCQGRCTAPFTQVTYTTS